MTGLEIVGVSLVTYWAGCGVLSGAATLGRGFALGAGLAAQRQYGQAANAVAGGLIAPALRVKEDAQELCGDVLTVGRAIARRRPLVRVVTASPNGAAQARAGHSPQPQPATP